MKKTKNTYHLPATKSTPDVLIDYENKIMKMSGRCIIEDAHTFFMNLLQRIMFIDGLKYVIDLEYINSSSLKHIVSIMKTELSLNEVEWYYQEEDFDIEEKGTDIKNIIEEIHPEVKFTLIKKPM